MLDINESFENDIKFKDIMIDSTNGKSVEEFLKDKDNEIKFYYIWNNKKKEINLSFEINNNKEIKNRI